MSMGSHDKKYKFQYKNTFKFALEGIRSAIKQEKNMKFHLVFSLLVVLFSSWLSLSSLEWIFILFAIAGMIALEMINSAIERVVDLATEQYHPLAKQAKDIAAGAVLIYAIFSVIIGLIIFIPKIIKLF